MNVKTSNRVFRVFLACLASLMLATGMAGRVVAQGAASTQLPSPVGYVNDFAGVLSSDAAQRLERLAAQVRSATGGDLVFVTLLDLGGRPVEEVSLRLGREWKVGADSPIGEAQRNAGVVVLVVPKETAQDGQGRCRIEVGQGAEGFITDATAGSLCRAAIPQFQARDYSGAMEFLGTSLAQRYAEAFQVTLDGVPARVSQQLNPNPGISQFLMILVVVAIMIMMTAGRKGRRGCVGCLPLIIPGPRGGGGYGGGFGGGFGGGGGGGGFGGFGGGGGFSGGGGGSSW